MGLFGWLFGQDKEQSNDLGNNDNQEKYQAKTTELLNISIKLLRRNTDGGIVKIFFDGRDSEFQVLLSDSTFHRDIKHFGNDWKTYLCAVLNFGENTELVISNYLASMRIILKNPDSFYSDITLAHYYPYFISKTSSKKWFVEYMQQHYPEYELTIESDCVYFVV